MRVCILLLLVVGCWGTEFDEIHNFNETFKEYSKIATNTISSIENVLNASRTDLESFLDDAYSNNPILNRLTKMKYSDKCIAKFIDRDDLKLSLQIQNYQLQIPLHTSIMNIKEKMNYINSSLAIYRRMAENRLLSCKSQNKTCTKETAEWLESALHSLSCTIYPNCTSHSVNKRSTCLPGQFKCKNGQCITGSFYCDYVCQCSDCSDQPPGCVKSCPGFRCTETFHCILPSQKCNGADDCGDGSDEEGCPSPTTPTYSHSNCSRDAGDFLCDNKQCVGLEQVCDGYDDCGDWSDEDYCENKDCSPECSKKGGVCYRDSTGPSCLYECPPGTYETSLGCKRNPEAPLPTLLQVLEETPRLITRYAARLKYLKTKTLLALSKSLRELVKCKKEEFTSLSKIIDFSTIIDEGETVDLAGVSTSNAQITTTTSAPQTSSTTEQFDVEIIPEDYEK